jgi:hypothetical protein
MGQLETLSSSQIMFVTLFYARSHRVAVRFTYHRNLCNYAEPKPFLWAKLLSVSWHFFIQILVCRSHMTTTLGDALYKIVNQVVWVVWFIHNWITMGFQRTEHLWVVGSHNQIFTSSQLTWNSPPTDYMVIASILLGFISFHKHLHLQSGSLLAFPPVSSSVSSC